MWGDVLENLKPRDLRITPGVATLRGGIPASRHLLLSQGAPSNQQILDATKRFYSQRQPLVDATTVNSNSVASSHRDYVGGLNGNNWQSNKLTQTEQNQTSQGIFGDSGGSGSGGLFGPTLDNVKASQLFTTISVGVSVEAIAIVGGLGGLGCAWDIAKREGPRGYGFATLELGLKVAIDINVQACIFNLLPSQLDTQIYGMTVGINYGLGATFSMFFTGMGVDVLGYGISIGIGFGGGAAVFGGHIWNFG
jgi:hypothetical protein